MTTAVELNETIARKVLTTVDAGLVNGIGRPEPGQMCVEAAVCFAYGLPHSDNPPCVGSAVRAFKIRLNDSRWSNNAARTKGMRKLAIAQLGSDVIDQKAFAKLVVEGSIRQIVPIALRAAASCNPEHAEALEGAAVRCEQEGTGEAAKYARSVAEKARKDAYAYAYAAAYADAAAAAAAYAYADAYAYAYAAAYADAAAAAAAYAYADAYAYAYAAAYADAAAYAYAAADAAAYAYAAADADADAAAAAYADAYAAAAAAAYAYAYADAYAAAYAAAAAYAYAAAAADAAAAAYAAAYAAAARDRVLTVCAEIGLQALVDLKSPGVEYLWLCEESQS